MRCPTPKKSQTPNSDFMVGLVFWVFSQKCAERASRPLLYVKHIRRVESSNGISYRM